MELILNFITPGPLTERCKFSARVISSWITLGIVLDFILVLTNLNAKNIDFLAEALFVVPCSICIFGLIGLAISSIRGESLEYPGWYWYLFPLVSYIVFAFWLTIGFLALVFGLMGISLYPEKFFFNTQSNVRNLDLNQLRKKFPNLKVKDILKDFEKDLEQMDRQNKLNPKQKDVVRKLRQFDGSKYDKRLQDVFENDELEELILLILILLGVEIH